MVTLAKSRLDYGNAVAYRIIGQVYCLEMKQFCVTVTVLLICICLVDEWHIEQKTTEQPVACVGNVEPMTLERTFDMTSVIAVVRAVDITRLSRVRWSLWRNPDWTTVMQ